MMEKIKLTNDVMCVCDGMRGLRFKLVVTGGLLEK